MAPYALSSQRGQRGLLGLALIPLNVMRWKKCSYISENNLIKNKPIGQIKENTGTSIVLLLLLLLLL